MFWKEQKDFAEEFMKLRSPLDDADKIVEKEKNSNGPWDSTVAYPAAGIACIDPRAAETWALKDFLSF